MAATTRIFALNLGMQTVALAEFRTAPGGGLSLFAYREEELIVDPAADATRSAQIEAVVERLRKEMKVPAREKVNFCLPSHSVFTRFVKLPGSSPSDIEDIIGFEAQQNVPFPIDEVVWDHQILGESVSNNWNVALVAMKADQLTDASNAIAKAGFRSAIIDVAPMALYNSYRYNYSELTGCSLLIDIGSRTTNLVFIEGSRVFSRSIPLGGNMISAAIAKEFKQEISVGEKLKIEKGFVGLGGAYEDPEDPTEMRISKIIRNTMTRLHADIARSISFYRQNQGGSAPVRAFLCGRSVSLTYMVEFFSEKLQLPVEFFNPLRNVTVGNPEVASVAQEKAHALGELVGIALRSLQDCPVEINLRPPSVIREQELARRKPFLVLASICLLVALGAWWYYFNHAATLTQERLDQVNAESAKLEGVANQFTAIETENKKLQDLAAPLIVAAAERTAWAEIMDELASKLPSRFIWVTRLQPISGGRPYTIRTGAPDASSAAPAVSRPSPPAGGGGPGRPPGGQPEAPSGAPKIDALLISGLYLSNPPNNKEAKIIDEFVEQLRKSPVFLLEGRTNQEIVTQRTTPDGKSWAYAYTIILPLRNPISLP